MTAPIHTTQNWQPEQYDMVIDVRSPSEFADDHIEGAVNLPALFDDERALLERYINKHLLLPLARPVQRSCRTILPTIWRHF